MESWREAKDEEISLRQFSGGITNKLFCLKYKEERVLSRIYGDNTELFIDRERENNFMKHLGHLPFISNIFGRFKNGFFYQFLPGKTLSTEELPQYSTLISRRLAELHKQTPLLGKEMNVWESMMTFLNLLDVKDFEGLDYEKDTLLYFLQLLKDQLNKDYKSSVVLAHNDLLNGNILFDGGSFSSRKISKDKFCFTFFLCAENINFIDYEYGSYNFRGYDIGNHFCEFMGFELDVKKYPDRNLQTAWLTAYYSAFYGCLPTKDELVKLYREVNVFSLVSHLYWGTWAILQSRHSTIDFNYKEYGCKRFDFIFYNKDSFLKNDGTSEFVYKLGV